MECVTANIRKRHTSSIAICSAALAAIFSAFLYASAARADNVYGSIRGTVKDPSGAAVAGAKVTATNTATGISKDTKSEADGSYNFLQLAVPAPYTVSVEQTGFRKYQASNIPLNLNQTYVLDIQLKLGDITQTVTVEATQTQVETTSMELGTVINDTTILNMPLNSPIGRAWTDLMQLEPGVVAASDSRGGNGFGNFATNGSQPDQNSYLINGTDNNEILLNQVQVNPSVDAIAEFKMVTGTFNPEYGRNSGAVLNAIIKSGTNSFHGDVFDFYRDTSLNARNFFQPTPEVFHRNQFGGTIGGPIWKNHTFFFFSYQGDRTHQPETANDCVCSPGATPVFTPDQRAGSFPGLATSTGVSPIPLLGDDGLTHPAGSVYSAIFSGGVIPVADFNPVSVNLLKFVPLPTVGNLFESNPVVTRSDNQYLGRIDHTISFKDNIWFYGLWEHVPNVESLPFAGATVPGFPELNDQTWQQYVAAWNHTFSGNTLNESRLGYTRLNYQAVVPQNPAAPSSVGFTGVNPQVAGIDEGLPVVTVTGLFNLGFSTNGPQPRLDATYDFTDNFSKVVGTHALKFGFDMRRFEVYNPSLHFNDGAFSFGGAGAFSTGNAGADFLLGFPDKYTQASGDILNERAQEYYSYAQDQWKARSNLTITYGLGWSIDTPMVDNYHGNHAGIAFRPGQQSVVFPTAPVGYVFQGDPGVNAFGTTKFKDVAPRFGFAWSPNSSGRLTGGPGKASIRGGFGIYYNRFNGETAEGTLGSPPYALTSSGINDFAATASPTFANPFAGYIGGGAIVSIPNEFPYAPSATPTIIPPLFISVYDPNISIPYAENYSLTVERQLGSSSVVSLGYVGAEGHRLLIAHEINPGLDGPGCAADPVCVANAASQPAVFPSHYLYPGNIFASIGEISTIGNSNYNAFQGTFDKRLSHGLQFLAAYTWSRSMDDGSGFENSGFNGGGFGGFGNTRSIDPFNQKLRDYGPSIYDARNRIVVSYVYQIPSVRHFNAMKWMPARVAEGWQISGITTYQSGFPLDVVDSALRSLTNSQLQFYCSFFFQFNGCWDVPNVVGPIQYVDPRTSPTNQWFNPSAFAAPALGTQGNAGRNLLRGPGIKNWDFSLMKETSFTESVRLELRIEFFNIFNSTQFDPAGINTDLNAGPTFGTETLARDPRIVQLAGKFYF